MNFELCLTIIKKLKNYAQRVLSASHVWGLVSSSWKILLNLRLLSHGMSKLNASKIKERLRQVPTLKIIFLKYLKCMDLYRSLLKTDHITWHNLKSGPETRNPRPYDPGPVTLGPGTWDAGTGTLGPWDLGLAMLGLGILTPGTL